MGTIKNILRSILSLFPAFKRNMEAFIESEERFRRLAESTPMAIMLYQDDRWVFMNEAVERITGYSTTELMGMNFWEIVHPDFQDLVRERGKRRQSGIETITSYEFKIITKSGQERWVILNGTTVLSGGKPGGLINVIDIHDLKTTQLQLNRRNEELYDKNLQVQAAMEELEAVNEELIVSQRELEESERKYREIFNNIPIGIFRTAPDGQVLAANAELARILGYSSLDEFMSSSPGAQSFYMNPEDRREFLKTLETDGPSVNYETMFRRKDGEAVCVMISTRLRMESTSGEPILEGYIQDLTRQRASELERERLEKQLLHAQKMEAIGRLAGGIAHDFNNLLTAIIGNADLALGGLNKGMPRYDNISDILATAQRATELIRRLMIFSRKEVIKPEIFDLKALILRIERMLLPIIGENITLRINFDRDSYPINADPVQMEQLVVNLVINARDAMPQGGEIGIGLSNTLVTRDDERFLSGIPLGTYVRLEVADTGSGMDSDTMENIFEPFYTTKGEMGTGLGLSMVYGIIKQNSGYITVQSVRGTGSTFTVFLPPASTERVEEKPDAVVEADDRGNAGSETILIIEDEDMVRKILVRTLKEKGYRIIEAGSGSDALRLCSSAPKIDLILSDVILPDYNGPKLVDIIHRECPHMKVLYMSGYAEQIIMNQGVLNEGINFIHKPFLPSELMKKIREVLDG
ncbi:MAG TPA: PAS domain S-box protein [Spirochaetota bacterium]|nr:PAS domain S-box protein [Spirochaetota bacterium]HPI89709.1 PAS domain S-box protein [Spirochaetota bacterium]HPR48332.1 PAS domain S-box protein [Spirochaetota bacterium]